MNPHEINILRSLESDSTTSDDEILVSFGVGPVVYLKDLLIDDIFQAIEEDGDNEMT